MYVNSLEIKYVFVIL